jgi:UDP-N-acetylmuramoylalanine--D-glutamate ligase
MNKKDAKHNLIGVRALVIGLAREGTALTRFLAERGASVIVTDVKSADELVDSLAALAGLPVSYALNGHSLSLLESAEIVFVSPGVPLGIPLLEAARQRGLPLSSETRLFTRMCPAPVIGITGSSGKTTTTAMTGKMLGSAERRTWVGGNIGQPLIGLVEEIAPGDMVVMELSSFQLEFFAPWPQDGDRGRATAADNVLFDPAGWSPQFACILNVTPNHLDRHPSMEAYIAAKAHILNHQRPGNLAILNYDNPITRQMGKAAHSKQEIIWFSMEQEVAEGAFLRDEALVLRLADHEEVVCQAGELVLLGQHNLANTLAACALAGAAGAPIEAIRQVATTFRGVEHRLELVRSWNGVRWYNDSIATTPERAVAALLSFGEEPIVLLAGGRDKHLPWHEMAELTWKRARHLILFGEAADLIEEAMRAVRGGQSPGPEAAHATEIHQAGTLEGAVELAARLAQSGDVVLLSPGGTSFDAYANFAARGEHFRQLVEALE